MRIPLVPVAVFALTFPATVTAGLFDNSHDAFLSEHPRETMAQAWLVRVKPGAKARFYAYDADRGCPARTDACKARGYLVPGDIAVAVQTDGAFTYVAFTGSTGKPIAGSIESRLLERLEPARPSLRDWVGHWADTDEKDIVVSRTDDPSVLSFVGQALWGSHDPARIKNGGVNQGQFAAYGKPAGEWGGFVADLDMSAEEESRDGKPHLPAIAQQEGLNTDWTRYFPAESDASDDGRCRGRFRLLGPYLLVYTPLFLCGGMNVTFTGVYRRVRP